VISRQDAVLAGQAWFDEVFRKLDEQVKVTWDFRDGDQLSPNLRVCTLQGPARSILTGERTALNFLQTLSATATITSRFVRQVSGLEVKLLDTRKTIPGLRLAQKYAVTCGGGSNHRIGLFDAILIKENHIAAAGSISSAVAEAKRLYPDLLLEVEVENLAQLNEAVEAGAQRALLDNFTVDGLSEAVKACSGRIGLEASGGVNLDTVRSIAETGVDFISIGDLTKNVSAVDFSMRFL
jgi:nicotinate-nucleotide pyrophosphorylase (carboxylating)